MKAFLRESKDHAVLIDIEGENLTERVLLSHLQDQHFSILCDGPYGKGSAEHGEGMRLFIRNEGEIEISRRIAPGIERRARRESRRRKR